MNEFVKTEIENIEASIDVVFEKFQEMEKQAVRKAIAGLKDTEDKNMLNLIKHSLTMTFIYNRRASQSQMSLAVQLEKLINDKIDGL